MTAEEALKLVEVANSWVFAKLEENLSDIQKAIIQQILEGQKLKNIEFLGYANSSIQREYAPKLWRLLEEVTGDEKVGVKNLQVILERLQKRELPKVSDTITAQAEEREGENSQIQEISESYIENVLCHSSERDFVGRDAAITHINKLVNEGRKIIVIQAAGGVGKTTLAKQYLTQFDLILPLEMAKDKETITAVESVVEEWLKQYFKEEPGREFGITLSRLKTQLKTRKVGVLIDNLEPALDEKGRFVEKHNGYVRLLGILADENVQSVTLITSRERLCDDRVNGIYHYPLSVLDVTAWKEFFTFYQIKIDTFSLAAMHKVYGGNAKAMDILLGVMREDYKGDMAAYWQENCTFVETELKNLVESQFNRLQILDTEAYKLLCRLGCFRYQDVPRVSIDALLALLWDISEEKQKNVIKSLRNRCLVEFEKGEYWLHPVIREQAIERLKASGEWEEVNHKAAEFWTESVNTIEAINDAIRAFEAYHHYLAVPNYEEAAAVIIKGRDNKWEQGEYLGRSFYRIGLLQPMISGILLLLNNLKNCYYLSYLNNILGDIYWHTGDINKSIKCHQNSRFLVVNYLSLKHQINEEQDLLFKLKNLEIGSFMNIGICKLDLWELEEAINFFEITVSMSKTTGYDRCLIPALFGLSFAKSSLNWKDAKNADFHLIANLHFYTTTVDKKVTTWATIWLVYLGLTYKNLRSIEKSFEMYNQAISYAEESNYTQVKAKAFTGLAELYRIQDDFEKALSHHSESIELLDKIGAKCDLAEAYYQLGLTYQKMGETENSHTNFNEAIQLFNEMEAPKQVEKVQKAKRENIDS
ncbi:TPR repeat-containing protein [Anabaena sp. 90]|uniref:tetratricopeptide repeat protein n=1 Tax=Anabaena sp. 90 TaxID=46234 RepID=UPI00029B640A|nr:tetratricopeptide repeat protein [Anabaena sp. 90]AFW95069.1 TPR repeat-containing protein [Anabaena sp. 90]